MSKKLTSKEEKFALLCVELGNNTEAYKQAYNNPNLSSELAGTKAYNLLQKDYISNAVEELKQSNREKHAITREDIINMYLEIVSDSNDTMTLARLEAASKEEKSRFYRMAAITTNGDKLRALESLRKMLGYDKPEKIEHKVEVEINVKRNRD